MRMCRKCSKQVSDDSKICRDCGGILEEISDSVMAGKDVERERESPFHFPWAPEAHAVGPEEGDQQSLGEVVEPEKPAPSDTGESAWKCPQCGEEVPGTFDVCWKCLTGKGGEKSDQGPAEFFQKMANDSESEEESEPVEDYAEASGIENEEAKRPQSVCPRCGSAQMMFGVTVSDQGQGSNGKLQVVICGDPSALIFKDRLQGELRANICGDCGHVELRVANPQALYRHYRKSRRGRP